MSRFEKISAPCLELAGLSFAYHSSPIIDDLDFSIPKGAFTALIGPNGSGKSTILRMITSLLKPDHGSILLEGKSISSLTTAEVAKRIGVLAQGPAAPEGLTVEDLVQQGRYPHRAMFQQWSDRDARACKNALSLTGMSDLSNRRIDHLSGGQKQRAWIAMTLAQETPVLLLDEPTTFLDLSHQIEIMDLASKLVRDEGKTIVAVLHDLNQACRYADNMVLLKAGKVIASGQPKKVMTSGVIQEVFDVVATIQPDPVTGTPMCIPIPRPF